MAATTESVTAPDRVRHVERAPAHGLWSPALVPLNADRSIDAGRFVDHARWLLEQGCHGLALFGTTSEANSFALDEREGLLEAVLGAGIDPDRLMVGTGCCALPDSVRLTRHAAEHGCKRVLMLPPFYYKGVSDAGLLASYAGVIEAVGDPDLRIFLYHFPRMSGVPITLELVGMLRERFPETVVGLKDSSGDWENTQALLARFPGFAVFPGSELLLLPGLKDGAVGCISATANAAPGAIRAVFDAWLADDGTDARRQERASQVRRIIESRPMVPGLKYLAAHFRGDPAWRAVRPPLVEMEPATGEALVAELAACNFRFGEG